MPTVAICTEKPLVRRGLRTILETEGKLRIAAEFADFAQLRTAIGGVEPQVVVTEACDDGSDIALLGDGPAGGAKGVGVIMLIDDSNAASASDLLRTGTRGLVYHDDAPREIIRAVHTVAAGGAYLSPRVTRLLADALRHEGRSQPRRRPSDVDGLTDREMQIFQSVAAGGTNHEVARALFISEATVKSHFNRICKKLGIVNRVQAVILAREIGMITDGG